MRESNFYKYKIFYPVITGGLLLCSFNVALGASYSISPAIIDIKAEARDIIKKSVTITNDGQEKIDIYPMVNNVLVDESGVQKFEDISEADKATSLANWIQFPRGVIEIRPGEIKTIVFSIQVNLEALPDIYHARISFPSGGSTREDAEKNIDDSPFLMLNVEVIEKVNELLELKKFLSSSALFFKLPASFIYSIENIGNREIAPNGEVIIYDRKGKEVASLAINAEGKKISPGNVLDLESEFKEGSYFGKYKAFLNVQYGGGQKSIINDTIYFYVIPWQKMLMVLLVMVVAAWMLSVWIHRKRSHESSHSHALNHTIFHARNPRTDYYSKLEREVSKSRNTLRVEHPHNRIAVNDNNSKKHRHTHGGHVMDLRHHKRK